MLACRSFWFVCCVGWGRCSDRAPNLANQLNQQTKWFAEGRLMRTVPYHVEGMPRLSYEPDKVLYYS